MSLMVIMNIKIAYKIMAISCITGFTIYSWFLLVSEWKEIVLQLTVLAAVGGILGIFACVGLAMAIGSRPSKNIDNIEPESG